MARCQRDHELPQCRPWRLCSGVPRRAPFRDPFPRLPPPQLPALRATTAPRVGADPTAQAATVRALSRHLHIAPRLPGVVGIQPGMDQQTPVRLRAHQPAGAVPG